MITAQERLRVLQMLQEGKISPEAAAQLFETMEETPTAESTAASRSDFSKTHEPLGEPGKKARWLRVRVTDTDSGKPRVNVRVPMSLVSIGMKLGSKFAPEVEGLDMEALLQAAQEGQIGPFVDVYDDEDGEHVEVFLE